MLEQERERLDVVDKNDCIVETVFRDELPPTEGMRGWGGQNRYFRAVNGFVVNSKGQLWIPRRTATKRIYPNALDMSVSGCVSSGESYEQAFARELEEELGLVVREVPHSLLGYLKPEGLAGHHFMNVYEIRVDEVPNYNRDDFQSYAWYTPAQLIELLEGGTKAKSSLLPLVKLFYAS